MGGLPLIGQDADAARRLVDAFVQAAGTDPALDFLVATALDPAFPGAILAAPPQATRLPVFYGVAQTPAQWRRLKPLLLSFAGPTLTDFSGAPARLDPSLPHEAILATIAPAAVARLEPSADTSPSAIRALKRLIAMLASSPADTRPIPESTSRLLARVRDHLNVHAIPDAYRVLGQLRSEHRLDALNLKFLEVEILATAGDWRGLTGLPGFADLLQSRRPPAVTAALLEALYWSEVEGAASEMDAYRTAVRPQARNLIELPAPAMLGSGGWRLFALEALASVPSDWLLAQAALESGADMGNLASYLADVEPAVTSTPAPDRAGAAAAVLAQAEAIGGLSALEQTRVLLAQLTDAQRADLLQSDIPRRALAKLEDEFGATPPNGWLGWLEAIGEPEFRTAATIAREGAEAWPPGLDDPADASRLAEALLNAPTDPPASDRLLEGMPYLVAWLQRDPAFPRVASYCAYEAALDRLLLGGRTATPMLDSAAALARALLSLGPDRIVYARLLHDLLDFAGEAAGVRSAVWLLDLVDETLAAPASDAGARVRFWESVLVRIGPVARQLSRLQRLNLGQMAERLGWTGVLPAEFDAPSTSSDVQIAAALAGKTIAVYTLTISAAAQAGQTLRALAPDVDVRSNNDLVGSSALKALAENADLFVLVTDSATHAATNFIRARRQDRPLVYAAGKGAVSILRAVEDWVRVQ